MQMRKGKLHQKGYYSTLSIWHFRTLILGRKLSLLLPALFEKGQEEHQTSRIGEPEVKLEMFSAVC